MTFESNLTGLFSLKCSVVGSCYVLHFLHWNVFVWAISFPFPFYGEQQLALFAAMPAPLAARAAMAARVNPCCPSTNTAIIQAE